VARVVANTNPVESVLKTCPVGAPEVTSTTRAALATAVTEAPVYSVVLSIPLSDTQSGDPGDASVPGVADRPQGLTRSGSVSGATPD